MANFDKKEKNGFGHQSGEGKSSTHGENKYGKEGSSSSKKDKECGSNGSCTEKKLGHKSEKHCSGDKNCNCGGCNK